MKSDNEESDVAGILILEDGNYNITASDEGISAITSITIESGNH